MARKNGNDSVVAGRYIDFLGYNFYRDICNNTGYKGRIAVHEIMYMNENMRSAVVREKNLEVLRGLARENGMVTLRNSCFELVEKGITSIQELMTVNAE